MYFMFCSHTGGIINIRYIYQRDSSALGVIYTRDIYDFIHMSILTRLYYSGNGTGYNKGFDETIL